MNQFSNRLYKTEKGLMYVLIWGHNIPNSVASIFIIEYYDNKILNFESNS